MEDDYNNEDFKTLLAKLEENSEIKFNNTQNGEIEKNSILITENDENINVVDENLDKTNINNENIETLENKEITENLEIAADDKEIDKFIKNIKFEIKDNENNKCENLDIEKNNDEKNKDNTESIFLNNKVEQSENEIKDINEPNNIKNNTEAVINDENEVDDSAETDSIDYDLPNFDIIYKNLYKHNNKSDIFNKNLLLKTILNGEKLSTDEFDEFKKLLINENSEISIKKLLELLGVKKQVIDE